MFAGLAAGVQRRPHREDAPLSAVPGPPRRRLPARHGGTTLETVGIRAVAGLAKLGLPDCVLAVIDADDHADEPGLLAPGRQ